MSLPFLGKETCWYTLASDHPWKLDASSLKSSGNLQLSSNAYVRVQSFMQASSLAYWCVWRRFVYDKLHKPDT